MHPNDNDRVQSLPAIVRPSREEIVAEIRGLQRDGFHRILADFMMCMPDTETIKAFATKYPDRYVFALGQLAGMAGFTKEVTVTTNVHMVGALSDSALRDRLAKAEEGLNTLRLRSQIQANPPEDAHIVSRETMDEAQIVPRGTSRDDDDRTIDV